MNELDTSVAHPARRYNYWLGGKDNFEADRASGDEIEKQFPGIRIAARANRAFLQRAVRYLAEEQGVRQFLDIGTGLPTASNTHEVAQNVAGDARIVYVDNDPLVLVHARALLTSSPEGATAYIDADLREPAGILREARATGILDFAEPIALMLVAVAHFIPVNVAYDAVEQLVEALPSGSFLVLSHATYDLFDETTIANLRTLNNAVVGDFVARTREQIAGFFNGLHLVEPGLQVVSEWRPDPDDPRPDLSDVANFGAVARKP